MASSILKVKKAKGAYSSDDGGLFATIGWNPEANRFEARLYTWDGLTLDCVKMAARSKRLILAAKPILEMIK